MEAPQPATDKKEEVEQEGEQRKGVKKTVIKIKEVDPREGEVEREETVVNATAPANSSSSEEQELKEAEKVPAQKPVVQGPQDPKVIHESTHNGVTRKVISLDKYHHAPKSENPFQLNITVEPEGEKTTADKPSDQREPTLQKVNSSDIDKLKEIATQQDIIPATITETKDKIDYLTGLEKSFEDALKRIRALKEELVNSTTVSAGVEEAQSEQVLKKNDGSVIKTIKTLSPVDPSKLLSESTQIWSSNENLRQLKQKHELEQKLLEKQIKDQELLSESEFKQSQEEHARKIEEELQKNKAIEEQIQMEKEMNELYHQQQEQQNEALKAQEELEIAQAQQRLKETSAKKAIIQVNIAKAK